MTDNSTITYGVKDGETVYLVNQSTNTCLAVTSGSSPDDAVVGMAPYDGSQGQQWTRSGDQWLWGGNSSYCLEPISGTNKVGLGNTSNSSASWVYDESERILLGSYALDVPWTEPRTQVTLYPMHDGLNQKWWFESLETKEPEYLISQSTTTCLAVRRGSMPSDAEVGLLKCNGSKEEGWFPFGGSWQWAGNRSYCLGPDYSTRDVKLEDSSNSTAIWTWDEAERFRIGSYALDVPWEEPRTKVWLYSPHNGLNQKWWKFSELKTIPEGAPPAVYPFPGSDETTYKQEIARGIINDMSSKSDPLPYPRDVATFPGTVDASTPRITKKVTLDLSVLGQDRDFRMTVPKDWQLTDLYLPAGDVCQVILPETLSEAQALQITVRIGAQTDWLQPNSSNVINGQYKRMPIVSEVFDVKPGVNEIRSQYGGNIIFMFSEGEHFTVDVDVTNVVEAPYYRYGQTSNAEWETIKMRDAPQTIMESDKCVVVLATKDARKVTNPDELMSRYDEIMGMLNYAAGFDESEAPPRGKQWLVNDTQITVGAAHSGFPLMFWRLYFNMGDNRTPYDWVSWHELGHNYQQWQYWSYAYGSESTVNLFSLYIQEQLFDSDRLEEQNSYVTAADKVDNGMTFDEGDVWDQLVFLMEIKHAFPVGWEMFRQLNRTTRALSDDEAKYLAQDHQRQIDHVYKNLSKSVGYDLVLTYERWGLSLSQEAKDEIEQLGLEKAPGDLSHRAAGKPSQVTDVSDAQMYTPCVILQRKV
ncbi:TRPM8 channel-associated factor 3 [Penaeus vannamei]|uniref:TRPM8 channel-associated factor 3 n=1 Tax=Penaeus vannamei TaxID=6689 RepID=UPI00387FA78B